MSDLGRYLIVNADDLGLSDDVNRGVIEAHRRGIVTSASLMVRAPAALRAATLIRANPLLGVGLHVDMGEWVLRAGEWMARYEYVSEGDAAATDFELRAQVALFEQLTGARPDHLDSHQHVHLSRPELSSAIAQVARELGIGVRSLHPSVTYRSLYGQDGGGRSLPEAISVEAYVEAINGLSPGTTELGCHPGYVEDLDSDYRDERAIELDTLCDPALRAAISERGVRLIKWSDVEALH